MIEPTRIDGTVASLNHESLVQRMAEFRRTSSGIFRRIA